VARVLPRAHRVRPVPAALVLADSHAPAALAVPVGLAASTVPLGPESAPVRERLGVPAALAAAVLE
jgi:hypothetical protein